VGDSGSGCSELVGGQGEGEAEGGMEERVGGGAGEVAERSAEGGAEGVVEGGAGANG
jgi:hypothetical protein